MIVCVFEFALTINNVQILIAIYSTIDYILINIIPIHKLLIGKRLIIYAYRFVVVFFISNVKGISSKVITFELICPVYD